MITLLTLALLLAGPAHATPGAEPPHRAPVRRAGHQAPAPSTAHQAPSTRVIDRLMAVVQSQPITLSDVNAAMLLGLVPQPAPPPADRITYTLDRLIERSLILTEVERYQPPEPAPESIDARYDEIKTRVGGGFDRDLADTGLTRDLLRRYIRDDLRIATYLNQRFGGGDRATRERVQADWLTDLRRRSDVTVVYLPPAGRE